MTDGGYPMSAARLWAELNVGGIDYEPGCTLDYDTTVARVASAVEPLLAAQAAAAQVWDLADELDAYAQQCDDAEPVSTDGLMRMILGARLSRDAASRIRRALAGAR